MTSAAPSHVNTVLSINEIHRDPEFQIRAKTDRGTITRYVNVLKSGGEMPPVTVARVDGVFILVDGFHRMAAFEALGRSKIDAEVHETTHREALWMAGKANMKHGLPLKTPELRLVFKAYVRAGQHKAGRGKLKSYREIGEAIGKSHSTIRNWMKQDFPRVAAAMGGDGAGKGGLEDRIPVPTHVASARESLSGLQSAFQATGNVADRETILRETEGLLQSMKETAGWREEGSLLMLQVFQWLKGVRVKSEHPLATREPRVPCRAGA